MKVIDENQVTLIDQLIQGSEKAFSDLYDLYSLPLYRNIFRLVKDEDISKELLQDLFLKVWETRSRINPDLSFKSFLYKIGENLMFGHFRKVAKDKRLIDQLVISSAAFSGNIEEKIILKEREEFFYKAIKSLPEKRKQVYHLCKLEGKSYEEAGNELGISTSTVSDHMVKANKAIKQYVLANQDMAIILILSELLIHTKN